MIPAAAISRPPAALVQPGTSSITAIANTEAA